MTPSSAITRIELGSTYPEFDLKMNQTGFIGHKVLRPRVVGKNAADVGKIPLKQLLQSKSTERSPGAGFARDSFKFDKFSYAVKFYGKEEPLADEHRDMYIDLIDGEQVSADRAEDAVLNEYERDVASAVFNTGTWTGAALTTTLGTPWSTHASADPIADVSSACEAVAVGSGLEANALIINRFVLRHLLQVDKIVDRVKYTQTPTAVQLRNDLSALFDLKYIFVAGGFKNTANEGQAASMSRIWSNTMAMVARVAETEDPKEPCIGRTFMWSGDSNSPSAPGDGGAIVVSMKEYRDESINSNVFQASNNRDLVIMHAQAGHLLQAVTA